MSTEVTISSVEFRNFKAFRHYSLSFQNVNILVGPNNSGKSTIISAFRVLVIAMRYALHKRATLLEGPEGDRFGYLIPEDNIPISLENVHTDYEEVDTSISFRLTNGNKLILYFPKSGGCFLFPDTKGKQVTSPASFKSNFPIKIDIVPVLGPVEQNEIILNEETIKKGLSTHRASRHFRNYWMYYPEGFEDFAKLIQRTWPGMVIESPRRRDTMSNELVMFCIENRIPREIYWSGFGFQVWCQLLTHIARCSDSTLLIVDEPEVYLHPDVQRQLIGILRNAGPDILLATHSTEIISDADASEILLVDKSKRSALRLRDVEGVQRALDIIGSVQNITLTHLARTQKLLFVEGLNDYKIIRRFAQKVGFIELASGNDITAVESGGFSSWERVKSFSYVFHSSLKTKLYIGAIYDRDYWCNEELSDIQDKLTQQLSFAHIHERKEIENYLLVPKVLDRVLKKAIKDKEKRTEQEIFESEDAYQILDRISISHKNPSLSQYIAKRQEYLSSSNVDSATINNETLQWFENKWSDIETRMEIVPGKEVLRDFRSEIQRIYGVSITDNKIIDEFKKNEIPNDILLLLEVLEEFRTK
jgi:energy-coupling factor transporter ATP-binding protein EcfA2